MCDYLIKYLDELLKENEQLKKLLTKELSENDEFGMEYTVIVLLKDENAKLKKQLALAIRQRNKWADYCGGSETESMLRQDDLEIENCK